MLSIHLSLVLSYLFVGFLLFPGLLNHWTHVCCKLDLLVLNFVITLFWTVCIIFIEWYSVSTQWPSCNWNNTAPAAFFASFSNLNLPLAVSICNTSGIISSVLIWSKAFRHFSVHWDSFWFFCILLIGIRCFLMSLKMVIENWLFQKIICNLSQI